MVLKNIPLILVLAAVCVLHKVRAGVLPVGDLVLFEETQPSYSDNVGAYSGTAEEYSSGYMPPIESGDEIAEEMPPAGGYVHNEPVVVVEEGGYVVESPPPISGDYENEKPVIELVEVVEYVPKEDTPLSYVKEPVIEIVKEVLPVPEAVPGKKNRGHGGWYPRYWDFPRWWGNPKNWELSQSQVLTGGSLSAANGNVLTGGTVSSDHSVFKDTKTNTRTKLPGKVEFGMSGGDGSDSNNTHSNGVEYNGGTIVNFLSKVQGVNNQGVVGSNDMHKKIKGLVDAPEGSYVPAVEGSSYLGTS